MVESACAKDLHVLKNRTALCHVKKDNIRVEQIESTTGNLVYENDQAEPELHARTYVALAAMFLLNFVQVVALQGPPAVVSTTSIRSTK